VRQQDSLLNLNGPITRAKTLGNTQDHFFSPKEKSQKGRKDANLVMYVFNAKSLWFCK